MSLFNKSIGEQISKCKNNTAAFKVASKIKTLGDCCEFIEFCPGECNIVGEKVMKLITDDRALYRIIMSNNTSAFFKHMAFDKINPSYYLNIYYDSDGKVDYYMMDKIKPLLLYEKQVRLERSLSLSNDISYLEDFVNRYNADVSATKKALDRLIDLYDANKRSDVDFNYKVIELFKNLRNYVPDAFDKLNAPMALLMIVREAKLNNYKKDALFRAMQVGKEQPMENAYRLGLSKGVYEDLIKLIDKHFDDLPNELLPFFKNDFYALDDLWKITEEYSKLTVLIAMLNFQNPPVGVDLQGRIIDLFSNIKKHYPNTINSVNNPQYLFAIAKCSSLNGYKSDAVVKLLEIGYRTPMPHTYRLGLSEDIYNEVLSFISGKETALPDNIFSFFKNDIAAMRELKEKTVSEDTRIKAVTHLLNYNGEFGLSRDGLLREYEKIKDDDTYYALELKNKIVNRLCSEDADFKKDAIFADQLDFSAKRTLLFNLSKTAESDTVLECANFLIDNLEQNDKTGNRLFSIARALDGRYSKQLGIEITEFEHEEEDQFGRYTTSTYDLSYKGKTYYDVSF